MTIIGIRCGLLENHISAIPNINELVSVRQSIRVRKPTCQNASMFGTTKTFYLQMRFQGAIEANAEPQKLMVKVKIFRKGG
ncbi:hypothetical protein CY34DRAFT_812346 [Suillus luteus UH-Slu-Lm8-n1]|uniref:Uncharacterized protein n=1 Tax=Suillus luteus UH-Slu-Lm8-n1 TaxID=930992 RepID=A0A0D0AAS3_9AGAM|nr:hypothetical protein CY34DRAFT_812346 [Suillus luteus UH-Slu-Lm8-n1]